MKKRSCLLLLMIVAVLLVLSCSPYVPEAPESYLDGTWTGVFKGFWSGMNKNYLFWSLDSPTDEWDLKYDEFLGKFEELGDVDYSNPETVKEAGILFIQLLENLHDGHFQVNLKVAETTLGGILRITPRAIQLFRARNPECSYDDIYNYARSGCSSSSFAVENTSNIVRNVFNLDDEELSENQGIAICSDADAMKEYITDEVLRSEVTFMTATADAFNGDPAGPGSLFKEWVCLEIPENKTDGTPALSCFLGLTKNVTWNGQEVPENTIYMTFSEFSFTSFLGSLDYSGHGNKNLKAMIKYIFKAYKGSGDTAGLIVDVRGNPGGSTFDFAHLFSDCVSEPYQYGWCRTKSGDNRLDYQGWVPILLNDSMTVFGETPKALSVFGKPVVALINRRSVSGSESLTWLVKSLPKGCSIGETTWGGNGVLWSKTDYFNCGKFNVGDYMETVYTPNYQCVGLDKASVEGKGITPDITVECNQSDFESGKDSRLERAFQYIKENL